MRLVPWWVLFSSACAPVLLISGWTIAERLHGPDYDPVTETISILAAYGAPGYWVITGMLIALGTCHVATARGLRPAALPGRAALAGGGVSSIALTLLPAPSSGGSLGHGAVVTVGFTLLAAWPILAADRRGAAPWGLRPVVAILGCALMCAAAAWFLIALQSRGAVGVAERVLTFTQSLWPLLVVTSCLKNHFDPGEPRPWLSRR